MAPVCESGFGRECRGQLANVGEGHAKEMRLMAVLSCAVLCGVQLPGGVSLWDGVMRHGIPQQGRPHELQVQPDTAHAAGAPK